MIRQIELQIASSQTDQPSRDQFEQWVGAALNDYAHPAEVVIRIVDGDESRSLNQTYRNQNKPTNVLSFPFEAPPPVESDLLGDLVICEAIVFDEAAAQKKALSAHWAHMVIHGTLHLLGYDHQDEVQAEEMETLEIEVLAGLGYSNPYQ